MAGTQDGQKKPMKQLGIFSKIVQRRITDIGCVEKNYG